MTEEPRVRTTEECRQEMFKHMAGMLAYWRDIDIRPGIKPENVSETHYRMEGFLFSLLVMFDGGSADLPSFDISPAPHPEDEAFHRDEGENWWPSDGMPINDTQMHEIFPWEKCR